MIELHTVKLNHVPLHYIEVPGPGPALVIVHGITGSYSEFLHLLPELEGRAHVYLLDLRGHGRSVWAKGGYQVADYGRDVAAFLRQVVGQPAIMLGHSLGSMVAVWLAVNTPHLLRGIILEELPFYILKMPRFRQTGFYNYFVGLRDYLNRYRATGASFEKLVAYIGQSLVDEQRTWLEVAGPEVVRERAIQLHQVDPAVLNPLLAGTLLGPDQPDNLLRQIRCPVHLVAAQFNLGGVMNSEDIRRAIWQMPHCTHTVIENAGHDIHLDQPQAFARELKQFLMNIQVAAV